MKPSELYAKLISAGASHEVAMVAIDALATQTTSAQMVKVDPQWKINKRERDRQRMVEKREERRKATIANIAQIAIAATSDTITTSPIVAMFGGTIGGSRKVSSNSNCEDLFESSVARARPCQSPIVANRFDEFLMIYPKRAGGSPRKPALIAYQKAIDRGHTEAEIIAGAASYAASCDALGKTKTEHVAHAATFLNQDRFKDDHHVEQPDPQTIRQPNARPSKNTLHDSFAIVNAAIDDQIRREAEDSSQEHGDDAEGLPRLRQISP